jgi:hypothetical protein
LILKGTTCRPSVRKALPPTLVVEEHPAPIVADDELNTLIDRARQHTTLKIRRGTSRSHQYDALAALLECAMTNARGTRLRALEDEALDCRRRIYADDGADAVYTGYLHALLAKVAKRRGGTDGAALLAEAERLPTTGASRKKAKSKAP